MKPSMPHRRTRARQRGAVLVVGLIFLAMLTLMGVAAYSVASQEERMTGNSRDRTRAFQAAETALRECEAQSASKSAVYDATGTNGGTDGNGVAGGFFQRMPPNGPSYGDVSYATWSGATFSTPWYTTTPLTGTFQAFHVLPVAEQAAYTDVFPTPVCMVEAFDVDPGVMTSAGKPLNTVPMARVTAHGWGTFGTSQITLQSTFLR